MSGQIVPAPTLEEAPDASEGASESWLDQASNVWVTDKPLVLGIAKCAAPRQPFARPCAIVATCLGSARRGDESFFGRQGARCPQERAAAIGWRRAPCAPPAAPPRVLRPPLPRT